MYEYWLKQHLQVHPSRLEEAILPVVRINIPRVHVESLRGQIVQVDVTLASIFGTTS